MSPEDSKRLARRSWEIEDEHRRVLRRLMDEYNNTVFYPARRKLAEDCTRLGHGGKRYHDNGVGAAWYECSICGTKLETEYYGS